MPLSNPAENVFLFKTSDLSCNAYLIKGKEKNVLIDSGTTTAMKPHTEFLKELNLRANDINAILHTHGHYDHFQADKLYDKAKIFLSEFDSKHLEQENPEFTRAKEQSFYPKINSFLTENQLIELNPFSFKVIFTPGHTKGSVCFYEQNKKMLFSGDTLFFQTIGRTDLQTGSFTEIKKSIQKLSELEIEYLFPGHGNIIQGLKENQENFKFINENFF
ncbi:MAG: hypothetical protein COX63_02175 [Candidatus Diapherotrites archaeon CG_4_10_14_0_2_um_filter_31_5]|nr:MAG: hypothetical protein COX63_02175 [Candidatus Diapherotrites archaeon CG_4_10_14_0_2_um_filter_31_5]